MQRILLSRVTYSYNFLEAIMIKRKPDVVIGDGYLERWYVIPRNRYFNIYLHKFTGSDDDRATHDHPWNSVSFLLKGKLREIYGVNLVPGMFGFWRDIPWLKPIYRSATFSHRLVVEEGPVWTLFITGPRIREWGFLCPNGWVHWKQFTDETGLKKGAGCGEVDIEPDLTLLKHNAVLDELQDKNLPEFLKRQAD